MTVLLDTGPLVAFLDKDDPRNPAAERLLSPVFQGMHGLPVTTDAVYDEAMTLVRVRVGDPRVSRAVHDFFWRDERPEGRRIEVLGTDLRQYQRAGELQLRYYDQGLSLTDCTLVLHAQELEAPIATFERGLRGVVGTLPPS